MLMRRQSSRMQWATVLGTAAMFVAGCGDEESTPAPATTQPTTTEAAADAPSEAVLAMLVKADAADDDKTDKVIANCAGAGCNLGMAGKAEFVSKVGEYTLHLCSADCKKGFDADPSTVILALKIGE